MALAEDLLEQAQHLVVLDPRKPKQASLRRSISTAYYALFHLLTAESVRRLAPASPAGLASRIARSLSHTEMREVCAAVMKSNLPQPLQELQPSGFSPELQQIASAFVQLQAERHRADYDLSATFTRADATHFIEQGTIAFHHWSQVRNRDEATVFLAALMFAKRWSK
jgi:uncharacterized protein (UPF0332 family)